MIGEESFVEAIHELLIMGISRQHDFEGHPALQIFVKGQVDVGHTAAINVGVNPVLLNLFTDELFRV